MKQTTYMRATVVLADGSSHDVLVGLCDRVKAREHFGRGLQELQDGDPEAAEQWLAYAAWVAARRQGKTDAEWDAWLEQYVGMEFDDGADPGTTPA